MNTNAFINAIRTQAIKDMKMHGILASLTIAQAILESAWGESGLTKKANNLFGIKCGASWRGDYITLQTKEWTGEKYITVNAKWRSYPYWKDSVADHTRLLLTDRYKRLVGVTDYKKACHIIKECGYATSPSYPQSLINIIEQYELYNIDREVLIDERIGNMKISDLQNVLNNLGITDKNGNKLAVDNSEGALTRSAKEKAKEILAYILK